jgi:RNA polymerase sigma-70 factor (sigma-E family)
MHARSIARGTARVDRSSNPERRAGNLVTWLCVLASEMVMTGTNTDTGDAVESAGKLDLLYRTYSPDALRVAYLLTGDRALAEDLMQEAFVRVLGRFRDLRNGDAFWWYLRRTIVNLSNSHFRRLRVERAHLARERSTVLGMAEIGAAAVTDVEERERMRAALAGLRSQQRAAIVLRFYEDLSEAETADILGCAVGTVKSMVSRGMASLRGELTRGE